MIVSRRAVVGAVFLLLWWLVYQWVWEKYTVTTGGLRTRTPEEVVLYFKSESVFYYSYYEEVVLAPSFAQGVHALLRHTGTEYPDTINVLARFNVHQELVMGVAYRVLATLSALCSSLLPLAPATVNWLASLPAVGSVFILPHPVVFYLGVTFAVHSFSVLLLASTPLLVFRSYTGSVLAGLAYLSFAPDISRVTFQPPLRESFGVALLVVQSVVLMWIIRSHQSVPYEVQEYRFKRSLKPIAAASQPEMTKTSTTRRRRKKPQKPPAVAALYRYQLEDSRFVQPAHSPEGRHRNRLWTLFTCLTTALLVSWQFAQFVVFTQVCAVYAVWVCGYLRVAEFRSFCWRIVLSAALSCLILCGNPWVVGSPMLCMAAACLLLSWAGHRPGTRSSAASACSRLFSWYARPQALAGPPAALKGRFASPSQITAATVGRVVQQQDSSASQSCAVRCGRRLCFAFWLPLGHLTLTMLLTALVYASSRVVLFLAGVHQDAAHIGNLLRGYLGFQYTPEFHSQMYLKQSAFRPIKGRWYLEQLQSGLGVLLLLAVCLWGSKLLLFDLWGRTSWGAGCGQLHMLASDQAVTGSQGAAGQSSGKKAGGKGKSPSASEHSRAESKQGASHPERTDDKKEPSEGSEPDDSSDTVCESGFVVQTRFVGGAGVYLLLQTVLLLCMSACIQRLIALSMPFVVLTVGTILAPFCYAHGLRWLRPVRSVGRWCGAVLCRAGRGTNLRATSSSATQQTSATAGLQCRWASPVGVEGARCWLPASWLPDGMSTQLAGSAPNQGGKVLVRLEADSDEASVDVRTGAGELLESPVRNRMTSPDGAGEGVDAVAESSTGTGGGCGRTLLIVLIDYCCFGWVLCTVGAVLSWISFVTEQAVCWGDLWLAPSVTFFQSVWSRSGSSSTGGRQRTIVDSSSGAVPVASRAWTRWSKITHVVVCVFVLCFLYLPLGLDWAYRVEHQTHWRSLGTYQEQITKTQHLQDMLDFVATQTEADAVFAGNMPTLSAVKWYAGRRVVLHPQYEKASLRERVFWFYGVYGRRFPQEIYRMLTRKLKADYFILNNVHCHHSSYGIDMESMVDKQQPGQTVNFWDNDDVIDPGVMNGTVSIINGGLPHRSYLHRAGWGVPKFCSWINHALMPDPAKYVLGPSDARADGVLHGPEVLRGFTPQPDQQRLSRPVPPELHANLPAVEAYLDELMAFVRQEVPHDGVLLSGRDHAPRRRHSDTSPLPADQNAGRGHVDDLLLLDAAAVAHQEFLDHTSTSSADGSNQPASNKFDRWFQKEALGNARRMSHPSHNPFFEVVFFNKMYTVVRIRKPTSAVVDYLQARDAEWARQDELPEASGVLGQAEGSSPWALLRPSRFPEGSSHNHPLVYFYSFPRLRDAPSAERSVNEPLTTLSWYNRALRSDPRLSEHLLQMARHAHIDTHVRDIYAVRMYGADSDEAGWMGGAMLNEDKGAVMAAVALQQKGDWQNDRLGRHWRDVERYFSNGHKLTEAASKLEGEAAAQASRKARNALAVDSEDGVAWLMSQAARWAWGSGELGRRAVHQRLLRADWEYAASFNRALTGITRGSYPGVLVKPGRGLTDRLVELLGESLPYDAISWSHSPPVGVRVGGAAERGVQGTGFRQHSTLPSTAAWAYPELLAGLRQAQGAAVDGDHDRQLHSRLDDPFWLGLRAQELVYDGAGVLRAAERSRKDARPRSNAGDQHWRHNQTLYFPGYAHLARDAQFMYASVPNPRTASDLAMWWDVDRSNEARGLQGYRWAARALSPASSRAASNLAAFVDEVSKDFTSAEQLFLGVALRFPLDAANLCKYAGFLKWSLETKQSKLTVGELDPHSALPNGASQVIPEDPDHVLSAQEVFDVAYRLSPGDYCVSEYKKHFGYGR